MKRNSTFNLKRKSPFEMAVKKQKKILNSEHAEFLE